MVENPAANVGNVGSIPGLGGFHMSWGNQAHELELLSLRSGACALQQQEPPQ